MNNPLDAVSALRTALNDLSSLGSNLLGGLSEAHRAIRLRLSHENGVLDDALLAQHVSGVETMCGGIEYQLLCVSPKAGLPLKEFIAMPIEVQFVTDTGGLRSVCGVVVRAVAGQCDGGLATYMLVIRDALSLMQKRTTTRVFRNKNEVEITQTILQEWHKKNPILARAFNFDLSRLMRTYPAREFTKQHKESDAAFLRRLWKRRGLAWFFEPGNASATASNDTSAHTLVLFDDVSALQPNAAATVRYHRTDGTEQRDCICALQAVQTLSPGSIMRQSWDYKSASMMRSQEGTRIDQGTLGNQFAASLEDYDIDTPHAGDSADDYRALGALRMQRHEYEAQCMQGEGAVRDMCVGEWNPICGHPELDLLAPEEREFVITELRIEAQNNLPKTLHDKTRALFALNQWSTGNNQAEPQTPDKARYTNRFTCVRRATPIVPAYDPRIDLPPTEMEIVTVVGTGSADDKHCDEFGRIKIRFPGCRPEDHEHAQWAGASNSERDSAWVQVATSLAGAQYGAIYLPPVGSMGVVLYQNGDPDKPLFILGVHSAVTPNPVFDHTGSLPGNRYQSGIVSQENQGRRTNQLKFEDTTGQISAQLASDHAHSQLTLGELRYPRADGQADPRGEGLEARTNGTMALRGGQGILITSSAGPQANHKQLERGELIGLAQTLQSIVEQLGELATTHNTSGCDPAKFRQLSKHLQDWENGSNTAPDQAGGGAPIVAVSAKAGAGIVSQDNLVLGAQTHIDAVSAGHTQLTAGKQIRQRAAQGVSTFAHKGGIHTVAAQGNIDMQAHQGDMNVTLSGTLTLTAGVKIILQAPEIQTISQGAQTTWSGGAIIEEASGGFVVKSPSFAQSAGGGGMPAGVSLPTSDLQFDQHVRMTDLITAEPLANQRYSATLEDGQVIEGTTDAQGYTQILKSTLAFSRYTLQAID